MQGLMMDYQLNVPAILRRADELYGDREIVSRLPDKSWHRFTYADFVSRTKRLAVALRGLGLDDGDRVATLMWNHHEHLETYVGAPAGGFVTHTLNLRLHPDDNTYIASHAGDRVLVVDKVLWPLAAHFVDPVGFVLPFRLLDLCMKRQSTVELLAEFGGAVVREVPFAARVVGGRLVGDAVRPDAIVVPGGGHGPRAHGGLARR